MATDRDGEATGVGSTALSGEAEFEELLTAATGGSLEPVRPKRSLVTGLLWLLSLIPAAALGLLVSMAVRVRLDSGVWPVRNQPDPKDLGIHNTVTTVAILVSFVAVLLVPLIALVAYFRGHRRIPVKAPIFAVVSLAILFAVLVGDVGGLGDWIGD